MVADYHGRRAELPGRAGRTRCVQHDRGATVGVAAERPKQRVVAIVIVIAVVVVTVFVLVVVVVPIVMVMVVVVLVVVMSVVQSGCELRQVRRFVALVQAVTLPAARAPSGRASTLPAHRTRPRLASLSLHFGLAHFQQTDDGRLRSDPSHCATADTSAGRPPHQLVAVRAGQFLVFVTTTCVKMICL